jgi:hypothetical protein
MIKAGQQRRFEMESTQEEKLNSVDVSLSPLTEQIVHRENIRRSHALQGIPMYLVQAREGRAERDGSLER